MTAPTPQMGGPRPYGEALCSRAVGPTINHPCGKRATWHIQWVPRGDNGYACDEHYAEARQHVVFNDAHPFGVVCGMPETMWIDSEEEPPGLCRWLVSDETLAIGQHLIAVSQ